MRFYYDYPSTIVNFYVYCPKEELVPRNKILVTFCLHYFKHKLPATDEDLAVFKTFSCLKFWQDTTYGKIELLE